MQPEATRVRQRDHHAAGGSRLANGKRDRVMRPVASAPPSASPFQPDRELGCAGPAAAFRTQAANTGNSMRKIGQLVTAGAQAAGVVVNQGKDFGERQVERLFARSDRTSAETRKNSTSDLKVRVFVWSYDFVISSKAVTVFQFRNVAVPNFRSMTALVNLARPSPLAK